MLVALMPTGVLTLISHRPTSRWADGCDLRIANHRKAAGICGTEQHLACSCKTAAVIVTVSGSGWP